MRAFAAVVVGLILCSPAFAEDIALMNGRVIDGTGKARFLANVRIRDGKIVDIGLFKPTPGETVIDVKGMIVAPGFIDLQALSPAAVESGAASLVAQGVTTAVLGSDGSGPYSVEDFMSPFDEKPAALNIAVLVGHSTVRRQIMGDDYKRGPTADEVQRMAELVSDGMKQGAFGFGADLQREPASFSTTSELLALAKATAAFGGTVVMRLRDENQKVGEAVKEAIAITREAKVSVHVLSTHKGAVAQIDKARAQRVDIAADSYSVSQFVGNKTITLENAVQRLSSGPAARMAFRERGVLRKGDPADVVVFDPSALPAGMKLVFVNGELVVKDGRITEVRSGHALR
jgi:N-acyl-D-amino-acid deacylase